MGDHAAAALLAFQFHPFRSPPIFQIIDGMQATGFPVLLQDFSVIVILGNVVRMNHSKCQFCCKFCATMI